MGNCAALPKPQSNHTLQPNTMDASNNDNNDSDGDDCQMSQNNVNDTNSNQNTNIKSQNTNNSNNNIDDHKANGNQNKNVKKTNPNNSGNKNNTNDDDDDGDSVIYDNDDNNNNQNINKNKKNLKNDSNNNKQQKKIVKPVPIPPQFKYNWRWLENDGTWHDYDSITQSLLNRLSIGNKITIKAGRWSYDITKVSNDSCSQINTSTQSMRTANRIKIPINNNNHNSSIPSSTSITSTSITSTSIVSGSGYIGSGRYVFLWQFLENDSKWKDLGITIGSKLDSLPIGGKGLQYNFGKYSYLVNKITDDECTQTNTGTQNQRDLRRILYDKQNNKRIVWEFNDDKGGWTAVDNNNIMLQLITLKNNQCITHKRGQWKYQITKLSNTIAQQKNTSTKKTRNYRLIYKNKDDMDTNWSSKATTNNSAYKAGYKASTQQNYTAQYNQYLYSQLRRSAAVPSAADDQQIQLDPNDVQDIVITPDLLNDMNNLNKNDNNNNNNKNNIGTLSKIKSMFNKMKNNDDNDDMDDIQDEEDLNNNNNDDDSKMNDDKSEKILMDDRTREIYNEFCLTMPPSSVKIISIQKIKDNASKSIVYEALLSAKKMELKEKKLDKIEKYLFHGTTFKNVPKIVNNGFNRDFNQHHLYGKGTYFSSLASASAKYCEVNENQQYVMLICRVIVGEYTKGTQKMDGSSIPYKPNKKTQYESCVNDINSPTIFVINRDYHAIPTNIITFSYKK